MNKKTIHAFAIIIISMAMFFVACGKAITTTSNDISTESVKLSGDI